MNKLICFFLSSFILYFSANADSTSIIQDPIIDTPDFVSASELLNREADDTVCSTGIFARALSDAANQISEDAHETEVQQWIQQTFSTKETLQAVLACPEFTGLADDDAIKFMPIEYNFPGGRQVIINYETQPKILRQRIAIAEKRELPNSDDPNPRIGASGDTSVWTNTDPAWYAIMVVEAGALDNFVGPDKNNTISLKYIEDNIDDLYPSGYSCTSKSALANNSDMLNQAVHNSVDIADDTNDYYVAGDVNLQWISYLEIAADIAITVITFGSGAAVLGTTKAARASRTLKNLSTTLRELTKLDSVRDYIRASQRYTKAAEELKKLDKAKDAAAYAKTTKEMEKARDAMRALEKTDDVKKYREASTSFSEINQYRHALQGLRKAHIAQRGNIVARGFRALKAANTGNKMLNKGAKIARSSMKSGKIRDWLFQSTMRNAGKLAKMEEMGGVLYGVLKFAGDMYDWTETSTGDFTNGLEFKPLLLLSADDLQGQENVVNYGMWLMWLGDTISAADDDAAYLQAMDTATKVHQDLVELQTEKNSHPCNVDIYVVRPVIRNPGTNNQELYYLIMNDVPWTTKE